jgi:hypothetical protein
VFVASLYFLGRDFRPAAADRELVEEIALSISDCAKRSVRTAGR